MRSFSLARTLIRSSQLSPFPQSIPVCTLHCVWSSSSTMPAFVFSFREEACAPPDAASAGAGGFAAAAVTASRSSCGAQRKDDRTETKESVNLGRSIEDCPAIINARPPSQNIGTSTSELRQHKECNGVQVCSGPGRSLISYGSLYALY